MTTRRIFVNGRYLSQRLSGVQRYASEFVRALDPMVPDLDLDVELVVPRVAAEQPGLRNISVRKWGHLRGHLWEQLELPAATGGELLLDLGNTAPLVKRNQLVVLHDAAIYAAPGSFSRRFRAVYRVLLPLEARRVAYLATVSAFSRQELATHLRMPADRFLVAHCGSDHIVREQPDSEVLAAHGLEVGSYVLAIGGSQRRKNIEAVAAGVAAMRESRPRLVVVAPNDGSPAASGVIRVGPITDAQLRALYENALCLVFPSTYEGFGLPPLEAMACGCPVVAGRSSSLPEICGDAALFVDPADPVGIAREIERCTEADVRADLIDRGRRRAARFTWAGCVKLVLSSALVADAT